MARTLAYSRKAEELSLHFLETRGKESPTSSSKSLMSQIEHRLMLAASWDIAKGSRVLEIGCGQGDCTIVIADAVGEDGHVDAIDPGSPDYGSPFTLSQAQSHILQTSIGSRITFHNIFPIAYLQNYTGPPYDYVILCHCLYYFESPSILPLTLTAILPHTKTLLIAEWSLHASSPSSIPHVLTALLLSIIHAHRKIPSDGNIRTVQSPQQIKKVAEASGFKLGKEDVLASNEGLKDAYWEVSDTLAERDNVLKELRGEEGVAQKMVGALEAMYDALEGSVSDLAESVKGVRSMDVWVAKFEGSC